MPTFMKGDETLQNPIRFKNRIKEAEKKLIESGMEEKEAYERMIPAYSLMEDDDFWQNQSKSIAVFISPTKFEYFRLPVDVDEFSVVNSRFHIKPLLKLFNFDGKFYLLTLTQQDVEFYECTHNACQKVELEDIPTNIEDALWSDDPDRSVQYHSGTQSSAQGAGGKRPAIFHGQGKNTTEDYDKNKVKRFFQMIDKGLTELLSEETAPMVLAGQEHITGIYKQANNYNNILDNTIVHNPDDLEERDAMKRAWEIVEPVFRKEYESAKEKFGNLMGTGKVSSDLEEIVRSANDKRIDYLFVTAGEHAWGRYDTEKRKILTEDGKHPENTDLLDHAAVQTFTSGGKIFVLPPDDMPSEDIAAAIFRY